MSLSDGGRVSVMESGGAGQLLGLLQRAAQLSDSPEDHQLRLVATGFLLNLLNSYETMQVSCSDCIICHDPSSCIPAGYSASHSQTHSDHRAAGVVISTVIF